MRMPFTRCRLRLNKHTFLLLEYNKALRNSNASISTFPFASVRPPSFNRWWSTWDACDSFVYFNLIYHSYCPIRMSLKRFVKNRQSDRHKSPFIHWAHMHQIFLGKHFCGLLWVQPAANIGSNACEPWEVILSGLSFCSKGTKRMNQNLRF